MMKAWQILKPSKTKIALFIPLVSIMLCWVCLSARIFPCKWAPTVPDPVYQDGVCYAPGRLSLGVHQVHYPSAYALLLSLSFVIPIIAYIVSCIIGSTTQVKPHSPVKVEEEFERIDQTPDN